MHSSKLSLAVDIKCTRSWYYFTIFVKGDIKIVTRQKQLQTIANQAVISVIKLLRTFTEGNCRKFPQGKEFKAILSDLKKV